MSYLMNAVNFLLSCVFYVAIGVFLMRFLLIAVGASFYEPFCRAIYTLTNPVITPLRRVVPSWRRFELASLLVAWLLMMFWHAVVTALFGGNWLPLVFVSLVTVLNWIVWIELIAIFLFCILGFFPSVRYDSNFDLLRKIIEPVWGPFRRRIPPLGVLDMSCWVASIALILVQILIIAPLYDLAAHLP